MSGGAGQSGEVCVTCADRAVAARVVELGEDGMALVDTGSGLERVSVALVDARPGTIVLVHAGTAIGVRRDG